MQRYALFLSGYDYNVAYKNTNTHGNADSLSQLPLSECGTSEDTSVEMMYMSQIEQLPNTCVRIKQETGRETAISHIYESVMCG
jgi:hypothetical protein